MRIAYYSDNFYPEISGISDSIITTGMELMKRSHSVLYVAPWYPAWSYKTSRNAERDTLDVVRLPSIAMLNSPTGHSRIALPVGYSVPRVRAFKPDIIHVQSPYGAGLEGLATARILGIPVIGTNHTPLEEFVRYVPLGSVIKRPALAYDSWFYNRCRTVTAPYAGLIDEMRKSGFQKPGGGMPNPVPFAAAPMSEEQKRAKLNLIFRARSYFRPAGLRQRKMLTSFCAPLPGFCGNFRMPHSRLPAMDPMSNCSKIWLKSFI
jgi:1,2-diacylglycerol 3-alpha-glucosyltransferase